ncbi:MAG: hypothetical protein HKP20_06600 [Akkermansiaceae bacterium]|nr:hypothetical protein [Akkermansiaceae bacterium]
MSAAADQPEQDTPRRIYKVLLMILPVGVLIGTIVFMFMYFYLEREEEKNYAVIVSHGLRISDLEDMVNKFTDRIGERDLETEQGRVGLRRAASMIEGRLGPQNVGFPVSKSEGEAAYGLLWKSLAVEIEGAQKPDEIIFAAVSYSGAGKVADANCTSTLMMLASAMARQKTDRTLRFVFLPLDKSPAEQNRWLLERCLKPGEKCFGIIGLKTMEKPPVTGEPAWQLSSASPNGETWWNNLRTGDATQRSLGTDIPSVWLTHPVFSPATWADDQQGRFVRTMEVAKQLRKWLDMAASG